MPIFGDPPTSVYAGPYIGPENVPPFKALPPAPGETIFLRWRRHLAEVGGWDNPFVQTPSIAVRAMIKDGEAIEAKAKILERETVALCDQLSSMFDRQSKVSLFDLLEAVKKLRALAEPPKEEQSGVLPFTREKT